MVSARLADGEVFDSAKLKNTVRFLIENDMRNVVIDLGNLEYLYSDTINAFIASNRHMLEVSGRIAILTEHPKVQDILKRAGLDNIMRIYRSEAEMIADSKEILRQTSSYRIEELQKISTQPQEHPQIPKTEFDEFKAEMGQRLGSKLDNNELPQYQLGVPQNPAPTAPNFGQGPREPETAYPTFNAPSFPAPQVPEAPPQYPQGQPAPSYNTFGNKAFGMGAPVYPQQSPQNFNQAPPQQGGGTPPPNFDFPTVQLPVGQFGANTQQPPAPPQGGAGQGYPPNDADLSEENQNDSRQRKSAQERMRSPNARRQQGRRVGGREFPGQEDEVQSQPMERTGYGEERAPEPPIRDNDKYAPYNMPPQKPTNLVEEARFPAKLIVLLLLIGIGVGGYFFLSKKGAPAENPPMNNVPVTPAVTEPAPAVVPPTTPTAPAATAPATVPAPATGPAPLNPKPLAETPKPAAPSQVTPLVPAAKPTPEPPAPKPPKVAAIPSHKTKQPKAEKVERPAPVEKASEEPAPAALPKGLRITSNPPGAEVLINFSKKGTTPLDITLSNNSNKIILRLPGYKRYETTLPKNHPEHELTVELEKEESAEPPVAKVVPKPVAPKPEPRVEPKPEPEAKAAPEYQEPEDLPVAKSKPVESVAPPKPAPEAAPTPGDGPIGIIFLSSSPARADIIIDGKNTGKKTPAKVELPSGNHRIEMSKSGQKGSVNQVVNEGKNKAVHLTLQ